MPDFLAFDSQKWCPWNEPVTIRSVRPNSADVAAGGVPAARYLVTAREAAASNGVYVAGDERFTFATDAVGWTPKPRDTVTPADGVARTVLDVGGSPVQKFWKVTTRNLVLAADLRDTGTHYRATPTPDAAGKRVPNLAVLAGGVACRVQKTVGEGTSRPFDASTVRTRATAFLGQQIFPQLGDVFAVGGARYAIVGWKDPDRIDALMTLDLEAVP